MTKSATEQRAALNGTCEECGGNGYAGGVNTYSGEFDDICLICMGDGLSVAAKAIDSRLTALFPEWEADQRNAIAGELATAALSTLADRDGWRDISSVDRTEGNECIVFENGNIYVATFWSGMIEGKEWWAKGQFSVNPTHWRPLPAPPANPEMEADHAE